MGARGPSSPSRLTWVTVPAASQERSRQTQPSCLTLNLSRSRKSATRRHFKSHDNPDHALKLPPPSNKYQKQSYSNSTLCAWTSILQVFFLRLIIDRIWYIAIYIGRLLNVSTK